jgi:O-antigen ligase
VAKTQSLYPFVQRALSLTDSRQYSNEHHLLESQQALKEIFASPILGLGMGSHHAPLYGIGWAAQNQPTGIVHNTYVLIWMKFGLLGLSLFIWMAAKYASALLTYSKNFASGVSRPIIVATGSLLGLWFVILSTGSALNVRRELFTIALFAAMTLTLIRDEQRERAKRKATNCVMQLGLQR